MPPDYIAEGVGAVLGTLQFKNVEHRLAPVLTSADRLRCLMFGIRTGGVRHNPPKRLAQPSNVFNTRDTSSVPVPSKL
jgi:hypothetical protein